MKEVNTIEILAITELKTLQKRYGFNLSECQINWAISEIKRGSQSLSLYALAGMSIFNSPFEISEYFSKALKELNIKIPSQQEIIKNYAAFICKKLIDKKLSEHEVCDLLASVCIDLKYQDYYEWYELLGNFDMQLITESDFKKSIREKAQSVLSKK